MFFPMIVPSLSHPFRRLSGLSILCGFLLCAVVPLSSAAGADVDAREEILQRYETILLNSGVPPIGEALKIAGAMKDDGSWSDVDYDSRDLSDWSPIHHVRRLANLAAVLHSDELSKDQEQQIKDVIARAIDFWHAQRPQSRNWWHNEIGAPRAMRDAAVLLRHKIDRAPLDKLLETVAQFNMSGVGANLAWSAELGFHYGCFTGDEELITRAASLVWDEVRVGAEEGIQKDWSFYQHNARLQTWHYGRSYLEVVSKLAWQLRDTPWELPAEKRDIIDNYLIHGAQWVSRGPHASPAGLDRAISRVGTLDDADIREYLRLWADVSNNRPAIEAILARQEGQTEPLEGFRYFRLSDFAAYHHRAASIFLKTISDRTLATESINSENLLGRPYLSSGDHYVISNGREYHDMPPVWDWSRLPGLTTPEGTSEQLSKDYSGGIGDGMSGFVAMQYARSRESAFIELRKLWAFHDDTMYCLLGGWNVAGPWEGIRTSIEQCQAQGDVVYSSSGAVRTAKTDGAEISGAEWVLHNGIGYIPLNPSELRLRVGDQTGSWQQIRASGSSQKVTRQVVSISLEHSQDLPASGYIIVLGASRERLDEILENPPARIVRNQRAAQVIEFFDGPHMAAFYESYVLHPPWVQPHLAPPPEITIPIRVNRPVMAMWSDSMIGVVDPTHKGGQVSILWGKRDITLSLPSSGVPVLWRDGLEVHP